MFKGKFCTTNDTNITNFQICLCLKCSKNLDYKSILICPIQVNILTLSCQCPMHDFVSVPTVCPSTDAAPTSCARGLLLCQSGECIEAVKRCDGNFDCLDQSDENHCQINRGLFVGDD